MQEKKKDDGQISMPFYTSAVIKVGGIFKYTSILRKLEHVIRPIDLYSHSKKEDY